MLDINKKAKIKDRHMSLGNSYVNWEQVKEYFHLVVRNLQTATGGGFQRCLSGFKKKKKKKSHYYVVKSFRSNSSDEEMAKLPYHDSIVKANVGIDICLWFVVVLSLLCRATVASCES